MIKNKENKKNMANTAIWVTIYLKMKNCEFTFAGMNHIKHRVPQ